MPEHLIRLRGGWLLGDGAGGPDAARRVSLPLGGPPGGTSPVFLTRQFGRPPIDPDRERLALRLEGVAGLVGMSLNGRAMAIPTGGATDLELSPDDLQPTGNVLVLEVLPASGSSGEAEADHSTWGMVALVVRQHEPPNVAGQARGLLGDVPPEA